MRDVLRELEGATRRARDAAGVLQKRSPRFPRAGAPAYSSLAIAAGAFALGAVAIGALAIGSLAIRRMTIRRARIGRLEVDELIVGKLHVIEQSPPGLRDA